MSNSIRTKTRDLKRLQVHEPQIPNYENVDKLHAFYNATGYVKNFVLDGFMYELVSSGAVGIERIRKYKCMNEEDLYLYVHLASDVVLKVYPRYEVGVGS